MRITGTKKFLIIFLTLVCAVAAGVAGVLFASDVSAYGQTFSQREGGSAYGEYPEEDDNLQAPDDADSYAFGDSFATYQVYGYKTMTTGAKMNVFNHAGTNVTSSTTWEVFDDGNWYGGLKTGKGKMGQRTTVTLAPGETFKFQVNYTSISCDVILSCEENEHWALSNYAETIHWTTGTWVIDGDAPTGTVFRVYKMATPVSGTVGRGFQTNYPTGSWKAATKGIGYCSVWTYEIDIVRTGQEKPQLIDDGTGTISGDTKTMTFTGEPATISFSPDFGSGTLSWSAVPANIEVKSRSNHGREIFQNPRFLLGRFLLGKRKLNLSF